MPLGILEVGFGPGHIVLDGLSPGDIVLSGDPAPAPLKRGHSRPPPNFRCMSVVAKQLDGSVYHLVQR